MQPKGNKEIFFCNINARRTKKLFHILKQGNLQSEMREMV